MTLKDLIVKLNSVLHSHSFRLTCSSPTQVEFLCDKCGFIAFGEPGSTSPNSSMTIYNMSNVNKIYDRDTQMLKTCDMIVCEDILD